MSAKRKLVYVIVDRDNEGRAPIRGIYLSWKKALQALDKMGRSDNYYYGNHIDVHEVGGQIVVCCADEAPYNHETKRRDGPMWQPSKALR